MLFSLLVLFAVFVLVWFGIARYLAGSNLQAFDSNPEGISQHWQRFSTGPVLNQEHQDIIATLKELSGQLKQMPRSKHLKHLRSFMDGLGANKDLNARFIPVNVQGVNAEWVLAPGADYKRRTLYIHGGAWVMGSPLSHRVITTRFAELTGGAVLAIDYRLMPEHKRKDTFQDCRTAYTWLLEHGPEGLETLDFLLVAGDSAGGNMTLSTIAWARDHGLRAADAAIALSPATDGTMSSKTLKSNLKTDVMLGPLFAPLTRIPRSVLLWGAWFFNRIRPCHPDISPLHGALDTLPPTLIQASEDEMLFDDARRYQNKALLAGSSVTLQSWKHVVHVWQLFDGRLLEAQQAFAQIKIFLAHQSKIQ